MSIARTFLVLPSLAVVLGASAPQRLSYPPAPPQIVTDTYFGTAVADPYRWLEDRTLPETEDWIAKQCDRFDDYIQQLGPLLQLKQRILDYVDVETVDGIGKVGERYFYRKRRIREQQSSIFVMDSSTRTERLLVDPSSQGPYTSVNIHRVSADGNLLAYEVKQGGEDTQAIHIVAVNTGALLPDHLKRGNARGLLLAEKRRAFTIATMSLAPPPIKSEIMSCVSIVSAPRPMTI